MKIIIKTFFNILLILFLFFNILYVNAINEWSIEVKVTEPVPWGNCWWPDENWTVTCTIGRWFSSVTLLLWQIIKYFTFIASLWWVLYIIINWILYSMWWMDPGMKDEAKKRIIWTLIWLILLMLSWVILNLIAPWIYV